MKPSQLWNRLQRPIKFWEWVFILFVLYLLLPILFPGPHQGRRTKVILAKIEAADLATALDAYDQAYGHWPIPSALTNADVTFGIHPTDIPGFEPVPGTRCIPVNSDLIVALMDFNTNANVGHKLNPQQIKFLNAKIVVDDHAPGVSFVDFQYRDPWGNPYIISIDANYDNLVRDPVYSQAALHAHGAGNSFTNRNGYFDYMGKVMVWSLGPDGKASLLQPAETKPNQDNVLSWGP